MPEFMDGKNVADFVSPDVEAKLLELERLEDEDMRRLELEDMERAGQESDEDPDEARLAQAIRDKKRVMAKRSREERNKNRAPLPHKHKTLPASEFKDHLESVGLRSDMAVRALPVCLGLCAHALSHRQFATPSGRLCATPRPQPRRQAPAPRPGVQGGRGTDDGRGALGQQGRAPVGVPGAIAG